MDLNPPQLEAVTTPSGPLLVLAGAGTGKTRVVTYRIARLIRRGVPPDRIVGVTFTNKAADEMQERVRSLLGKRLPAEPQISTFHSLCVRILRRNISHFGYPGQFAIYDRHDQEGLARASLREIKCHEAALKTSELLYFIGRWKTASVSHRQAASLAQTDKEHLAAAAYRRYQRALKAAGAVDFDDLLLLVERVFRRFPKIRDEEAGRFDHILVDEYQDTNQSQYRIVKALAAAHRNLCVVGDDDQSIYGWRGAEITHILQFTKDWPDAKTVRLETNYRSTREVLAWANRLIAFNRHRHPKTLRATHRGPEPRILQLNDEEAEAKAVVEEICGRLKQASRNPRDFAILFRTNDQPRAFEMELRRAQVPYVLLGGQSFYDRKEVRDILAYLKLIANPHDEVSLLRVINTPPRGIGQTAVSRLTEEAVSRGKPVWDVLSQASAFGVSGAAALGIQQLQSLVERFGRELSGKMPLGDLVSRVIQEVNYREELERTYPDANDQQSRLAAVEEVVNAASSYANRNAKPTLGGFLQELALTNTDDDRDRESKLQRNAVALLTLHAAKGLEFPEVYMVGMEEGLLPHRRSIEADGAAIDEERRLCYVGITRAQHRLTLTVALGRRKWGKLRPTIPSRFLYEITGQADNPNYLAAVRQQSPGKVSGRTNASKHPHSRHTGAPTSRRSGSQTRR
jgi:DNA helicase-2/ATP-dependent DNA helicase PcrA